MDIKSFKNAHKPIWKSAEAFAKKARISKTYLYEIMSGKKMPSIEVGDRLEKASCDHIKYMSLVEFYKSNKAVKQIRN